MRYFVLLMMMMALCTQAQVWEDLSDEELENEPEWKGETQLFRISHSSAIPADMRPALQLDCEAAGTAGISFHQGTFPAMQWEFWIKLSFNTSISNFARIYLATEEEIPGGTGGVFLQFGGTEDSVWLGREDTSGTLRLFTVPGLYTGNSTNPFRMKIVRDSEGNWQFYGDAVGGMDLELLGTAQVPGTLPGERFGLYCAFTSSNATKFYFDDIYSGPEIVDSTGPALISARLEEPDRLLLGFDEAVDPVSASDTGNYSILPGIGPPYESFRMLDPAFVMLFFEDSLTEGVSYQLNVKNVRDVSGNAMQPTGLPIEWYVAKPYDIIINEIHADPSPPVQLPPYEFIELFNRTERPLDLDGWELTVSGDVHSLSGAQIGPRGYLLLMAEEALPEFKFCGPAVGFPSFSISNEGAALLLKDQTGQVICYSEYAVDKYADGEKSQGGWSLERTDPWYPCDDEGSWDASSDDTGGTPGKENSRLVNGQDMPHIQTICCLSDTTVMVRFDHALSGTTLSNPLYYTASHGLGTPETAEIWGDDHREAILTFSEALVPGLIYELGTKEEMADCTGIPLGHSLDGTFSLSSPCEPFDVIFNEVLFHPLNDGAEYIELYNRSGKTLHLDELTLAYVRETPPNPPDTGFYTISVACKPLFPGDFIALTKDPEKVLSYFMVEDERKVFRAASFPVLNNESGKVLLMDPFGVVIDVMEYSEEMHYPLLNSFAGVSLERVCTEIQCAGPGNWHSASSASGYGTPGFVNSQYQPGQVADGVLGIEPVVFSPDGDGKDDVLGISCRFDEPGMLISISIFTEGGRLAHRLVNTALAGRENIFYWDGLTDGHYPAPRGVYVVLLEAISMEGYSRKYKKAAILM